VALLVNQYNVATVTTGYFINPTDFDSSVSQWKWQQLDKILENIKENAANANESLLPKKSRAF